MTVEQAAGIYQARIKEYGLGKSRSKETLFAFVQFEIAGQNYSWRGFITGGATEFTLEALVRMGFKGTDLSLLADPNSNALDMTTLFNVKLEYEIYEKPLVTNGIPQVDPMTQQPITEKKKRALIKWVSHPDEPINDGRISRGDAVAVLQGMNLQGAIIEAQKKFAAKMQGQKPAQQNAQQQQYNQPPQYDDSIPF